MATPVRNCGNCRGFKAEVGTDQCPTSCAWGTEDRMHAWHPAPAAPSGYPDDNPKTILGLTKPSLSSIPPVALFHLGQAMGDGRAKYGPMNWRTDRVSATIYYDAALRHLMAWWDGEERASDSGVHHLAHAMGCLAILLDAQGMGQLNDDRPVAGLLPAFLAANTKKV